MKRAKAVPHSFMQRFKDGESYAALGKEIGWHADSIRRVLRSRGLEPLTPDEFSDRKSKQMIKLQEGGYIAFT